VKIIIRKGVIYRFLKGDLSLFENYVYNINMVKNLIHIDRDNLSLVIVDYVNNHYEKLNNYEKSFICFNLCETILKRGKEFDIDYINKEDLIKFIIDMCEGLISMKKGDIK